METTNMSFELNVLFEGIIQNIIIESITKKEKTKIRKYITEKYKERCITIPLNGKKYNHCRCNSWQRCEKHNVCMCLATTKCVLHCNTCKKVYYIGENKRNIILDIIKGYIQDDIYMYIKNNDMSNKKNENIIV